MTIDWLAVATIAAPIIALFIGVAIDRFIEQKPKLIAYYTHASAFNTAGNNPITIHTHGIIIKNIGRKSAMDVRVRHNILPQNYKVYPIVDHHVQNLPGGGSEIVFPILVQNEQVSISYLYFPPLIYNQIHAGIRHSEGFASEVAVLPTPQYPDWMRRGLYVLLILGSITFIYMFIKGCCVVIKLLANI
ncbi:MAG: hypothetical protein WC481_01390 [Candidatus Omnitrophota bacterium]